ncbi:MAG: substrate-binding domain-containing protein [Candidatus Sumerlaeia bacterium]|nr:substrate-binding domain-containing protein [Candidatus Sumerlaeia bacterium]
MPASRITLQQLLQTLVVLFAGLFFVTACAEKPAPQKSGDKTTDTAKKQYVIGFSQCTTTEPWRALFNRLLEAEAAKMPDVKLVVLDAQDRTEKQVADMESFITRKMDAILISPKEAPGLTEVVERATKAGIPVIVLDRDVNTKNYACWIGGDNLEIGREAGRYAVEALGGPGKAQGVIYEIWGGMASPPAQDRHNGFHEIVGKEKGIKVEGNQDGDWKQEKGYNIMETALKTLPKIDLVYAHNDPMAFGAYLAAKDAKREKDIKFVGIDAIPEEGCMWVKNGQLAATFVYPPPGVEGLHAALKILKGEKVPPRISLPTRRITSANVDEYLASLKK